MNDVIKYWFETLTARDWFNKSDDVDAIIRERFLDVYHQVSKGETASWRSTATGRLAEILVLDQFPRNMFRGTAQAFATDALALVLAQEGIRQGADLQLDETRQSFFYMPFMHSESALIHEQAMLLFKDAASVDYEIKHRDIIVQFGRYPHRNEALGRESTPEEVEWMQSHPGF